MANFFTPASQKAPEKLSWRVVDSSLIVGAYVSSEQTSQKEISQKDASNQKLPSKARVAAFDFDSTLIKTASGVKFARDANDWTWWHGSVPGKLKELHASGYRLVIMSNQNGIKLKPALNGPKIIKADRQAQFKQKAAAVFNSLNLPIRVYAATEKDKYRKPATGIWEEFLRDEGLGKVDLQESLFIGDAGGRKGDFSCSDRNFAANVGIRYVTPEEFFLEERPKPFERDFDPQAYLVDFQQNTFEATKEQEVVLFVGTPGAGKSTFFHKYLEPLGYQRINQDTLKSVRLCVSA